MKYFFLFTLSVFAMTSTDPGKILFDFQEKAILDRWTIINDGVMGGLSTSSLQWQADGTVRFSGRVSLENNGGFASCRTYPQDFRLSGCRGIQLRVKGDGKTYSFRIRTNADFDGINYAADFFAPAGEWTEVTLPFADFKPTFRGRVLSNVQPIDAGEIRQLGFLISDKQEGGFQLEIDYIKSF